MKPVEELLGETIKELRTALRLSQTELAELAGTSQVTVYKIETGKTATNVSLLSRIAKALKVSPSDLLAGVKAPPATPPAPSFDQALAIVTGRLALLNRIPADILDGLARMDQHELNDVRTVLRAHDNLNGRSEPEHTHLKRKKR